MSPPFLHWIERIPAYDLTYGRLDDAAGAVDGLA
jgi:hypothetical protein